MGTVLVVDDEPSVLSVLSALLGTLGLKVMTAVDGLQAVAAFRSHRPALVLTDVLMPVMDGIELIREIRRIDPLAKIVAMSGGTRDAAWCPLRVASLLGANRILEKPFDAKVLTAAVSDLLAAPRAVAADAPLPVRPNPGAYRFAKGTPVPRWFGEYASTVAEWGADVIVEVTETDAVARAADQPLAPGEFIIRGRSA